MSKPYSRWYVIEYENRKVGSIYLTHLNEIGIFVQEKMQGQHIGRDAIRLIIKKNARKKYLANISPENNRSIHFFKKNGFNNFFITHMNLYNFMTTIYTKIKNNMWQSLIMEKYQL